jgi:hypothetical protein
MAKPVLSARGVRVDFDALAAGAPKKTKHEVKKSEVLAEAPVVSGYRPADPPPEDMFDNLVSVKVDRSQKKTRE